MKIRRATPQDAEDLKILYLDHLTAFPPKEEQDMDKWRELIGKLEKDEQQFLLVAEEDDHAVSTVQIAIINGLTHNVRPFAVIENVVTHANYRNRGFASALLEEATQIAKRFHCYKIFLETGSNKESTLQFYRNNGFEIDAKHSCFKRL